MSMPHEIDTHEVEKKLWDRVSVSVWRLVSLFLQLAIK